MCFMAGANAVFTGEQMLTTPCKHMLVLRVMRRSKKRWLGSPWDEDKAMMGRWGLEGMGSFEQAGVARKEGARLLETGSEEGSRPKTGAEVELVA